MGSDERGCWPYTRPKRVLLGLGIALVVVLAVAIPVGIIFGQPLYCCIYSQGTFYCDVAGDQQFKSREVCASKCSIRPVRVCFPPRSLSWHRCSAFAVEDLLEIDACLTIQLPYGISHQRTRS